MRSAYRRSSFTGLDPTTISGLALWFDASKITGKNDGDAVSQWDDSSGNARHATQITGANQPLYKVGVINGKPTVRFDGSNDQLDVPSFTLGSTLSVFMVVRFTSASGGTDRQLFQLSNTNTDRLEWWKRGSDGAMMFNYVTGAAFQNYSKAWNPVTNTPYVVDGCVDATDVILGISGFADTTTASTGVLNSGSSPAKIGTSFGFPNFINADVAEFLAYGPRVSPTSRTAIRNYLSNKYAVTL